MATLKELLTEDASKYICRVQIGNLLIPYTNIKKFNSNNLVADKSTDILLYNIITDKFDTIDINSIVNYTVLYGDDQNKNETTELALFDEYKEIIKDNNVYDKILYKDVVCHNLHKVLNLFNFTIDSDNIIKNKPFDEEKETIISSFIEIVQNKVDKTLSELDELLTNTDDVEDIEDINNIKEIFNDVVSDMDLSELNTFTDLTDNWPPLLLPLPDVLTNAFNSPTTFVAEDTIDEHIQVIEYIENITDKNILSDFLKIIESNKSKLTEYHYNTLYKAINDNYIL